MPTLLHPFSPAAHSQPYQRDTWAALGAIEPALRERGWEVIHLATPPDDTYERTLRRLWTEAAGDLIVLEHDLVPTLDALLSLAACPHDLCAQCYHLHYLNGGDGVLEWVKSKVPTMHPDDRALLDRAGYGFVLNGQVSKRRHLNGNCWEPYCHRVFDGDICRWGEEDDEWADLAGLGLTRFSQAFMRRNPPTWRTDGSWGDLDGRISAWIHEQGLGRWHIHRPTIPHNHPCAQGLWMGDAQGRVAVIQPESSERRALQVRAPHANQVPFELEQFEALIADLRPRTVLEIGVDQGGTLTRWAIHADPEALLIGLDTSPPSVDPPHRLGQHVLLIAGSSHDTMVCQRVADLVGPRGGVDLLFIDGDHLGAAQDFADYAPLVRRGGIIAFHDIQPGPSQNVGSVPADWRSIRAGRPYREIVANPEVQAGYGIGVLFVPPAPADSPAADPVAALEA